MTNHANAEWLLARVVADNNGCWLWQRFLNQDGYGRVGVGGTKHLVHRLSYELHVGPIPPNQIIRHTCDVPSCCNPEHLIPGSHADNSADRDSRGRAASHKGEDNGRAKLTDTDVIHIRRDTRTHRAIAEEYGISRPAVGMIKRGCTWQHVKD